MKLLPTPPPQPEPLTPEILRAAINDWLATEPGLYRYGNKNRPEAANNLYFAVLRALRGAENMGSSSVLDMADADRARRRLRRAARLFDELADRLTDC